jgi:hypothetical protein
MAANIGRTWAKAVDFIISGEKRFDTGGNVEG